MGNQQHAGRSSMQELFRKKELGLLSLHVQVPTELQQDSPDPAIFFDHEGEATPT